MRLRFFDFELDAAARTLSRGGQPLHLTPKALDVLLLLAADRPRAVPKDEILARAWPGTFVTDASLARTIHEIRDALGDRAGIAAIRTVHGHGYSFAADATEIAPDGERAAAIPSLVRAWLVGGSRAIPLADGEVLIGRDPTLALPLESPLASWHHARLVVSAARVTIEDLGSKNGTSVGGRRLTAVSVLREGDAIEVGGTCFTFRTGDKQVETATRR